jgi:hypothetical protein
MSPTMNEIPQSEQVLREEVDSGAVLRGTSIAGRTSLTTPQLGQG